MTMTPCTICAINEVPFEGIEVDPICASCSTPEALAELPFAEWFKDLLDKDETCTNFQVFERAAYAGYLSYQASMDQASIPFDSWIKGFRQDPIMGLYDNNDARSDLAPRVNSYIRIMVQIMG